MDKQKRLESVCRQLMDLISLPAVAKTLAEQYYHPGLVNDLIDEGRVVLGLPDPPPRCPWDQPLDTMLCPLHGGVLRDCPMPGPTTVADMLKNFTFVVTGVPQPSVIVDPNNPKP